MRICCDSWWKPTKKEKNKTFCRFPVMWVVTRASQPLLSDAMFSDSLLLSIFHPTPRVRVHGSWNQTDLCDADVKPNSDILFITVAHGHRGASPLVTSILGRPRGPLFGVLSSICLLCSFQWQLPRDVPLRGSVLKQSFDIKNTGLVPTEKQTDLRICTVMS